MEFTMGYLNKHHNDLLIEFAKAFSSCGTDMATQNAWSGGSYVIESSEITKITTTSLELKVSIQLRSKEQAKIETVTIDLDADIIPERKRKYLSKPPIQFYEGVSLAAMDIMVRKLCRLCWMVHQPTVTGKLIQLAVQLGGDDGDEVGKLPEAMFLNQVPHNRYVRRYFYDGAADAALEACALCSQGQISNRMLLTAMFPEMNPSMDSYRIGTILELVRVVAIRLAEQNLRVRICVQGSMGVGIFTAVPKSLNGVSKLLQMMDWESEEGEENEGMVGNYLNFGGVGKEHVVNAHTGPEGEKIEQDDVFILIAPQSMLGIDTSIVGPLSEMVEAAGDRPVILMNPDLVDKVSAQGQQSVRGRKERIEFADSFKPIYHFQNIYVSGTSYFPILGSITKLHPTEQWVAHQRRDLNDGGELYVPVLAGEEVPTGEAIIEAFER